ETNVQLHKAEKAWKPEKVTETDEGEEAKKKLLLKTIRALFNKITPTTKDALINEFLDHKVYESPSLPEVISIIFDKAVEEPKFCPLYAAICQQQVKEELSLNNNVSHFRNAILVRAQETFQTKNQDDFVKEKEAEIEAETDEKKKK
uniref:MIF4G domain-containing protein n=1 Tax=Biomphalaria glabrata TaxID=6526 RepID=A0A2C9L847_BIOGL